MLPWKLLIWQMLQFMELFNCMKNGTRQHSPGSMSVLPRALSRRLSSAQLVFHPCRAAAARPWEVLWVSGSLSLTQNFLYSLQTDFCHVSFLFFIFWVSLWDLGASWVALVVKKLPINNGNTRDMGLIPGWGRSPGRGHGNPLQCPCLENTHGQRSLAGYSPYGHKESDMTEVSEQACTWDFSSQDRDWTWGHSSESLES